MKAKAATTVNDRFPNNSLLHRRSPLDSQILLFEDLQVLSGKIRTYNVEKWAQAQGIRYKWDGSGGIWTTVAALNEALGVLTREELEPYSLDIFV